jgi:diguanylate cyclase (GGDEF)-like protein
MDRSSTPIFRDLPRGARLYIAAVLALAILVLGGSSWVVSQPRLDGTLIVLALALGPLANLFEVFAPGHYSLQPNLVFFFWGAVLLPPWMIGLLAMACFLPGAFVHKFKWYMLAFNMANYAMAGVAANVVARTAGFTVSAGIGFSAVGALVAAGTVFLAVNYILILFVVTLSRRRPLRMVAGELVKGLPLDISLAMTGACLAVLWTVGPALVLLAGGPIVLAYRALWVPLLRHKSRTDPKTGLFNSEHFESELADALRAARKDRTDLSVAMFDLDHLRAVNNQFGHLTGDRVIKGIADLLRDLAPDGAVAARFGGEEFCLLLPNVSALGAREVAERIRARVQAMKLRSDDDAELAITASIGVAAYPEHGETAEALLQAADAALYDAKLGGRNRIRVAMTGVGSGVQVARPRGSTSSRLPERRRHERADDAVVPQNALPDGEDAAEEPQPRSAHRRIVPAFVSLLVLGAAAVGAVTVPGNVADDPLTFALLVGSVIALDLVRLDIFERGKMSPASMPTMALAFFFGAPGPLAAEGLIALLRFARRERVIKLSFDFGALALAGAAAAATFQVAHSHYGLPLVAAGVLGGFAYYAVNIPLLAAIIGLSVGERFLHVWREQLAWLAPHYVAFGLLGGMFVLTQRALGLYSFVVFGAPLVMLWIAEAQYIRRSRTSVAQLRSANEDLERANAELRGLLGSNEELLDRVHRSYLATITSLARTIDAKDPYTGGHTERVAEIARLIAIELGFDEEQLRAIGVGAVIHDIGKIGVADQILLKQGKLTEAEFAEMRRHPEISSYIIHDLDLPLIVKQMVRSHHERYDGSGYPDGLAGEAIPLAARVLTVADSLDAMTSDRPYRKALSLAAARVELEANIGNQFCPKVVSVLTRRMNADPSLWASLLATGGSGEPELDDRAQEYAATHHR